MFLASVDLCYGAPLPPSSSDSPALIQKHKLLTGCVCVSDLFVSLGVVQSSSSQRCPPKARRAGLTVEPPHSVDAGIRRETRLQMTLGWGEGHRKG